MENLVFTEDTIITESMTYGDVLLTFNGGSLVNNTGKAITLTGNNTKIVAPPYHIFKGEFNFEGSWVMDRAYPQWFGAVRYDTEQKVQDVNAESSTDAINKAIKFKSIGEVFVPKGYYLITNTPNSDIFGNATNVYAGINIKPGIQLVGEYTGERVHSDKTIFRVKFDTDKISKKPENPSNFAILFNIAQSSDKDNSPTGPEAVAMSHIIRGIHLRNATPIYNGRLLRGVLAGCSATFDTVHWDGFGQAVKYIDKYLDDKRIINCTFDIWSNKYTPTKDQQMYAFDMGSIGDALIFEHNQINNEENNTKGLRLNQCGGGSINANVINADVLINACKGINFTSNHLERGALLEIRNSNVTTSNNYFWRSDHPVIIIYGTENKDKSVVTINGDVFTFCDNLSIPKNLYRPVCEYDIAIDLYSTINISNSYRYWNTDDYFGKMYTCGLKLLKIPDPKHIEATEPFNEFNNHSYALSQFGIIRSGFELGNSFPAKAITENPRFHYMANSAIRWDYASGIYTYEYQIVWDHDRCLTSKIDGKFVSMMRNYDAGNTIELTQGGKGILFSLNTGLTFNLRLIRKRYNDSSCNTVVEMHYVDVPICGNGHIYDNGLSVHGFGWIKVEDIDKEPVIIGNSGFVAANFNGHNVVCFSSDSHADGCGWRPGDMIVNTGNDSSWTVKVIKE